VDKLDDRGIQNVPVTGIAAHPGRQKQNGRAHPLPPAHLDVPPHLRDQVHLGFKVPGELLFDASQCLTNRLKNQTEIRDGGGRRVH
jgi:hypothetical protein